MLYRAAVPGTKEPVAFSSPWLTITLDAVEEISQHAQLATDGNGRYEFSVPLAVLGWSPSAGQSFRGDMGVLRGNGFQTLQRVYCSNKATAITSDVPSEAELTPRLWGEWRIEREARQPVVGQPDVDPAGFPVEPQSRSVRPKTPIASRTQAALP